MAQPKISLIKFDKRKLGSFSGKKHSEETKKRFSEIAKNRIFSEKTKKKMSESHRGVKNHLWKGSNASYSAIHYWLYRNFGRPVLCENTECKMISKNFEWSNISGEYIRKRSDWQMFCKSCHKLYDLGRKKNG